MTETVTRDDRRVTTDSPHPESALAPPPKLRRRPALAAAAVVAICLGALLAAWAWTATANTHEVLAARTTIERGSVIRADDIARVRVSADPALSPVAASQFNQVVGQRAAVDIAAGSLLTPNSATRNLVPRAGQSVVGVALAPEQAPGLPLETGDLVRIVVTAAEGEEPKGRAQFSEAEVVGVRVIKESGQTVVDLQVPHAEATGLAARIASGQVALVLDSRER